VGDPQTDFCVLPDLPVLLGALAISDEFSVKHWHHRGEDHGVKWQGWLLCGVNVSPPSPNSNEDYYVVTQAARDPGALMCIYQVPHWPPQPEKLALESASRVEGKTVGPLWDDARELFGLINRRAGGRPRGRRTGVTDEEARALENEARALHTRGVTLKVIAHRLGWSERTIRRWLNGK
jgi:hypothetical protein